jgi:hypothetical protein
MRTSGNSVMAKFAEASKDTNRFQALYRLKHAALKQGLRRGSGQLSALIHRSAWNRISANFTFKAFCELRIDVLRSLRSAAKEIDEAIGLRAKEMGCVDAFSGDPMLSHALSGLSPGRRHP